MTEPSPEQDQDPAQRLRDAAHRAFNGKKGLGGRTIHINPPRAPKEVAPVPAEPEKAEPVVGDAMPDGTIYAGISPNTGEKMYAMAADADDTLTYLEAEEFAAQAKDAAGQGGFRIPTKEELDVLYQNKDKGALAGTFNTVGAARHIEYWSSSLHLGNMRGISYYERFSDGYKNETAWFHNITLRCVR